MIEHLSIGHAGHFFVRRRRITKRALNELFKAVRGGAEDPSRNLFKVVRAPNGDSFYSAIAFSYERRPAFFDDAFLDEDDALRDRVHGFLLIVEHSDHVAVFKAGLDVTAAFKSEYLGRVPAERVETAIAQTTASFQQLRLRNMSVSNLAVRSKTFEASDLASVVPTTSANRFIPQGYKVRLDGTNYAATPSTGRISMSADRAGLERAIQWSGSIIGRLEEQDGESSPFILNFARSIDLGSIPDHVRPTVFAIDVALLTDLLLGESPEYRLIETVGTQRIELDVARAEALLQAIDHSFPLAGEGKSLAIRNTADEADIGAIRFNKGRIAFRKFDVPGLEDVEIERLDLGLGEDPEACSLTRFIDREDAFTVLFDDMELAYVSGTVFRDPALSGGASNFLAHLKPHEALEGVTSEKGTFDSDQVEFDEMSVFRRVVDGIADDCDVLVCDDLGDEWADFIGVTNSSSPSSISFYHAKHGADSLGASSFHEAVGQGLKNLGSMSFPEGTLERKLASWNNDYRNDGVQTSITRIYGGKTVDEVRQAVVDARSSPDLARRVFIVTSSLSKSAVARVFDQATEGVAPKPHFIQLYWLLSNFFAGCREMGANGYVVCRP
ncbi:hypothetical protein [Erythrobacter sp.]|uniref:hypothetical protein n=1 Tax=Erythrobacter sp. TaxID=1042 RepID=UPI003C763378